MAAQLWFTTTLSFWEGIKGVLNILPRKSKNISPEEYADIVRNLIKVSESFMNALIYLEEELPDDEKLELFGNELIALIGKTLEVMDFIMKEAGEIPLSGEELQKLEDIRTAYKYLTGEISLNISEEELKMVEKEAEDGGCMTWEEFSRELGLSE